jgi:hypothetical protein
MSKVKVIRLERSSEGWCISEIAASAVMSDITAEVRTQAHKVASSALGGMSGSPRCQ